MEATSLQSRMRRQFSTPAVTKAPKTWLRTASGPQPCWHQGPVWGRQLFHEQGLWGWKCIALSCTLSLLLLDQFHLRRSGSRSQRLGAPGNTALLCCSREVSGPESALQGCDLGGDRPVLLLGATECSHFPALRGHTSPTPKAPPHPRSRTLLPLLHYPFLTLTLLFQSYKSLPR